MGDSSYKPKLSSTGQDPILSKTELDFMRIIEQKNLERVKKLEVMRKRNRITACAIGLGVLGIYAYTITAIKQETFLDDFEEPKKILKE